MKKPKEKKMKFKIELFGNYIVQVIITDDLPQTLKNRWPDTYSNEPDNTHAICLHFDDNLESTMVLGMKMKVGTIAHESWHVVRRMYQELGVELDNEAVAYALGFITQKVEDFYTKHVKRAR